MKHFQFMVIERSRNHCKLRPPFFALLFVLKQKVQDLDLFAKKVSITLKDLNSRGFETILNNEIRAALKQKIFLNASLQLFAYYLYSYLNRRISLRFLNAKISYVNLECFYVLRLIRQKITFHTCEESFLPLGLGKRSFLVGRNLTFLLNRFFYFLS